MTQPLVSVVLIFHDEARFLKEAIESVLAQTYEHRELLLVDDGSRDGSDAIAARYAAARRLQHEGGENRGTSASRNLGAGESRGEYVAFLDGDDVWRPEKLSEQVAILEAHCEAAVVYGAAEYWYGWTGDPADEARDAVRPIGIEPGLIEPPLALTLALESKAPVAWPSDLLVRRSAFEQVGGFEERFPGMFDDQAFLAKLCLAHPVFVSDRSWFRYRRHEDSLTSLARNEKHALGLAYLDWLETYVRERGAGDERLLRALQDKRGRYEREVAGGPGRHGRGYVRALAALGRRPR
jgi:glycosyltransferase involved in cell wall biosynthesis